MLLTKEFLKLKRMNNGNAIYVWQYIAVAAVNERQRLHRQWSGGQVTFDQKPQIWKCLLNYETVNDPLDYKLKSDCPSQVFSG